MSTLVEAPGPVQYVSAVRRALVDLGPSEIEELTGGLEADLVEALAESRATPEEMFGRPEDYAAELRAAAGLPARSDPSDRPLRRRLPSLGIRRRGAVAGKWLDEQSFGPDVRAFGVTCLPLWWVVRGYVLYQFLQIMTGVETLLPYGFAGWMLCLALMVASIELGRRDWARGHRIRTRLVKSVNLVVAVVAFFGFSGLLLFSPSQALYGTATSVEYVDSPATEGVTNNGQLVKNIFPYDAEGNLLENVQLFDDQGRMLEPSERYWYDGDAWENEIQTVPAQSADGRDRFNVYPLKETVNPEMDDMGNPVPKNLRDAKAPDRMQYPVTPPAQPGGPVETAVNPQEVTP